MTNDSLKAAERHFSFYAMHSIHPSNLAILKHYTVFHSEIENNVLQSSKVSAAHGIVIHSQLQKYFVGKTQKSSEP